MLRWNEHRRFCTACRHALCCLCVPCRRDILGCTQESLRDPMVVVRGLIRGRIARCTRVMEQKWRRRSSDMCVKTALNARTSHVRVSGTSQLLHHLTQLRVCARSVENLWRFHFRTQPRSFVRRDVLWYSFDRLWGNRPSSIC